MKLSPSSHIDNFARENLPEEKLQPTYNLKDFKYPETLNVGFELTDAMVEKGFGDNIALIGNGRRRTYKELTDWTNRLAWALVENYDVKPGNRVLIRSANNPAMVACWLAATKAGAVVVNTMPLLRKKELSEIIDKAEISHILCDARLIEEVEDSSKEHSCLRFVIPFDGSANHNSELDKAALEKSIHFETNKTSWDDVALLGFTSGTTGSPKATMHFHRDLLIIADGYAKEVLKVSDTDIFVGSPPLAFTFGLGGLAIFPLRFGATATLLEDASPPNMIDIIQKYKATVCFTAPTAYNIMLKAMNEGVDLSSLRAAVSAGETLPAPIYKDLLKKTGKPMLDGIGATELLHIFISNRFDDHKESCTGKPVLGYQAKIVDDDFMETWVGPRKAVITKFMGTEVEVKSAWVSPHVFLHGLVEHLRQFDSDVELSMQYEDEFLNFVGVYVNEKNIEESGGWFKKQYDEYDDNELDFLEFVEDIQVDWLDELC